jgi:hypothetical protein
MAMSFQLNSGHQPLGQANLIVIACLVGKELLKAV